MHENRAIGLQLKQGMRGYLELIRPANLPTAAADVMAGFAVAGEWRPLSLIWIVAASVLLYAGGVALNDVFDAEKDAILRPERPIPRGAVRSRNAMWFGAGLLAVGIACAFGAGLVPGLVAIVLAHFILLYDWWAKHSRQWGPLAMGLCRALNLLLGVSVSLGALQSYWYLTLIPVLYVGSITLVSAGESGEGTQTENAWALAGVSVVTVLVICSAFLPRASLVALPFVIPAGLVVVPEFLRAFRDPSPANARAAVKSGVLGLILFDAVLAAAFGGFGWGAAVALLFPISLYTSRAFQVA